MATPLDDRRVVTISFQTFLTSFSGSPASVENHLGIEIVVKITFALAASSIPLCPSQKTILVVVDRLPLIASCSLAAISLASCRQTAGLVLWSASKAISAL